MRVAPDADENIVVRPETNVRQRLIIYSYIGILFFVIPFTGLWGITARFLLKDHFHQSAGAIAGFLFLCNIPAYLGFVFGILRDRWSPFGRKDQGILLLFSGIAAIVLGATAILPITYVGLILVFVCSSIVAQFLASAQQGLTSVLGQERLMSGRLSSVWQTAAALPLLLLDLLGGYLSDHLAPSLVFLLSAAIALAITLFTLWRPRYVFDDPAEAAPIAHSEIHKDVARLFRAPGIIPIVVLLLIWNFTPGVGTPIQFYLTDTLHGNATQFGLFNSIFNGFFIPTFLLYGFLCTRVNFRRLIWVCTFVAVPQILPLLLVHNASTALAAAVPMGLMGGLATAAYFDLLIRACPPGLHGTAMMLGSSAWVLSGQLGNLAGAHLYNFAGFAPCAWATAGVYACLIPTLLFVPKHLTATRDGQVGQAMIVAQ